MTYTSICEQYQRATYVYHEPKLLNNYHGFQRCISSDAHVYYSIKANPHFEIIQSLHRAGAGMEVSSLYELHLAITAGVAPSNIIFIGPGKSKAEIMTCIKLSIRAIYCESLSELTLIGNMAGQHQTYINVVLRAANTHTGKGHQVSMSGPNSQFGMDLDTITHINKSFTAWPYCQLVGIHYYHGSNQVNPSNTEQQIIRCCREFDKLAQTWHRPMEVFGLGLGIGILNKTQITAIQQSQSWSKPLSDLMASYPSLSILCEAGRCLVGTCGDLIAQVRYTKRINQQDWAILDTGYHHHMNLCFDNNFLRKPPKAYAIYTTNKQLTNETINYQLCGPLCTPSDRIHNHFVCKPLRHGDFIVFNEVGAYGPSHAPVLFLGHAPAQEQWIDSNGQHSLSNSFERFYQFHYQGEPHAKAS